MTNCVRRTVSTLVSPLPNPRASSKVAHTPKADIVNFVDVTRKKHHGNRWTSGPSPYCSVYYMTGNERNRDYHWNDRYRAHSHWPGLHSQTEITQCRKTEKEERDNREEGKNWIKSQKRQGKWWERRNMWDSQGIGESVHRQATAVTANTQSVKSWGDRDIIYLNLTMRYIASRTL